jgi:serine/threonine protein kinase
MIYRNCMEFSMECCREVVTYNPQMETDLLRALAKLHQNHIVHFDIKPENICFSPSLNKYVFIDFGLSEVIP